MFYPQFKIDSKIQNAAAEVMKKITPRLHSMRQESVKVILYLLQATATVTGEETHWTWYMQRRWEQKMLWYAIIL